MIPVDGDIHDAWLVSSRDGLDRSVGVLTLPCPLPSQGDSSSLTDTLFAQYGTPYSPILSILHSPIALTVLLGTLDPSLWDHRSPAPPPPIHNPNPHLNPYNSNPP